MASSTPVAIIATALPPCIPIDNDLHARNLMGEYFGWPNSDEEAVDRFDAIISGLSGYLRGAEKAPLEQVRQALPFRRITIENHGHMLLVELVDHVGTCAYLRFDWYQEEREVGGSFRAIGSHPETIMCYDA